MASDLNLIKQVKQAARLHCRREAELQTQALRDAGPIGSASRSRGC